MGRASTKSNKNRYQLIREELGLSREKASELLEAVTPERICAAAQSIRLDTVYFLRGKEAAQ